MGANIQAVFAELAIYPEIQVHLSPLEYEFAGHEGGEAGSQVCGFILDDQDGRQGRFFHGLRALVGARLAGHARIGAHSSLKRQAEHGSGARSASVSNGVFFGMRAGGTGIFCYFSGHSSGIISASND